MIRTLIISSLFVPSLGLATSYQQQASAYEAQQNRANETMVSGIMGNALNVGVTLSSAASQYGAKEGSYTNDSQQVQQQTGNSPWITR